MKRILCILFCVLILGALCGCVDTVSEDKDASSNIVQYYFEDVCQAGGRFYFTTLTDESHEMTVLSGEDENHEQIEICRFAGTVHVDYVRKSYDSSNGTNIFFYVRPDIGSGRIYTYSIADNSIQIFLREDCSNMIPDTVNPTYAWVIKDSKLYCVNMAAQTIVKERSYDIDRLNLREVFPDGFFGKFGDCNVEITMNGQIIHVRSSRGSKLDGMTVTTADIDTALLS